MWKVIIGKWKCDINGGLDESQQEVDHINIL